MLSCLVIVCALLFRLFDSDDFGLVSRSELLVGAVEASGVRERFFVVIGMRVDPCHFLELIFDGLHLVLSGHGFVGAMGLPAEYAEGEDVKN